ncbi:MAG TPA: 4-hydroxy-tetrahydrodipicolinate reductase [Bacteroidales bacterium]|nr:4-hydroxy-tetrahydrodipicolinate reductase [Bacteroidales bacterium]
MRIALIGYGKMGKAVEQIALERGHTITAVIDINTTDKISENLKSIADIAIEFTSPNSAKQNVINCLQNGISVVSGTTGWDLNKDEFKKLCIKNSAAVFYASNFSIGVNVFMKINEKLAELLSGFNDYEAKIEETHHIHKLDKPSGTAITLANGIIKNNPKYVKWMLNPCNEKNKIEINSFREGEIYGDHKIIWENDIDIISISHSAKSRRGLAQGAIMAAEFVIGKIGVFSMSDLLKL